MKKKYKCDSVKRGDSEKEKAKVSQQPETSRIDPEVRRTERYALRLIKIDKLRFLSKADNIYRRKMGRILTILAVIFAFSTIQILALTEPTSMTLLEDQLIINRQGDKAKLDFVC